MPILLDGQPLASLPSSSSLTSRQRSHSSTASSAAGHDIDHDSRMNGSDGSRTGTAIRLRPSGSSLADRSVHNGSKRANNGIVNTGSDGKHSDILHNERFCLTYLIRLCLAKHGCANLSNCDVEYCLTPGTVRCFTPLPLRVFGSSRSWRACKRGI